MKLPINEGAAAGVPVAHPAREYCKAIKTMLGVSREHGLTGPRFDMTSQGFLLQNGLAFYAPGVQAFTEAGKVKQCYMNATMAAMRYPDEGWIYCEGVVFTLGIPIDHAFLVNTKGEVMDPTLRLGERSIPDYYGIPFCTDFVRKTIVDRGYYGVIDNPQRRFPLLRGSIPRNKFIHPAYL